MSLTDHAHTLDDPTLAGRLCAAVADGHWFWDLEDRDVDRATPDSWRLLGIDSDGAGRWLDRAEPTDVAELLAAIDRHVIDPDQPVDHVVRHHHADGSTVRLRYRGVAVHNGERPIRFAAGLVDVTPPYRELADLNERMELIIEGTGIGIWDWPDPGRPEVYWSPMLYQILGYRDGEIEASYDAFMAHVTEEGRKLIEVSLEDYFENGVPYDIVFQVITKGGDRTWVRATGQAAREGCLVTRMVGSVIDIDGHIQYLRQNAPEQAG
jgi:PAS domain S-box-containing protein